MIDPVAFAMQYLVLMVPESNEMVNELDELKIEVSSLLHVDDESFLSPNFVNEDTLKIDLIVDDEIDVVMYFVLVVSTVVDEEKQLFDVESM